jgi:hypothetical protein
LIISYRNFETVEDQSNRGFFGLRGAPATEKAAAGGLGAAEQRVREAHFREVRRILGFFCKSEGIARIAYKGGLQQGQGIHGTSRASGLLTQRMRGRPNSISSDILIAHINGSMAGALADSEAAVNSPTLARPKRCKNSLAVAKRSRPWTLVERLRLHRELKPGQPQYQKQKDQVELEEVDPGKASPPAWITEKHRRDGAV